MRISCTSLFTAGILLGATHTAFGQTGAAPRTLRAINPVSAQFEDGPPLGSLRLVPGEIVYFSFSVENFRKSDTGEVSLTGHVQAFDPTGTPIYPAEEIPILTTLSPEDKNWKPKLRAAVAIPPIAPPGFYKVK